ncbi:uncharacterized protein LOC106673945 [Cimex lectularius]|uniref:Uncharacterized protein n=1 Tax=Cimex lectularius TaxID=79782 RepID=A0A8I6SI42_CIMLE|nr:uncharacterized protein LOC106673945 [Cimex lectularius]
MYITYAISLLPKEAFMPDRPEMPINYWLRKSVDESMKDYLELRSEEFLLINVLDEFQKCELPLICRKNLLQRLQALHNFSEAMPSKRIVDGCASLLMKRAKKTSEEKVNNKSPNKTLTKPQPKKSTKVLKKLSAKNVKMGENLNEDTTLMKIKRCNETTVNGEDDADFENIQKEVLPQRSVKRSRTSNTKSRPTTPSAKRTIRNSRNISKYSPDKPSETTTMKLRARTVYYR